MHIKKFPFPASSRLKNTALFSKVFHSGNRSKHGMLTVFYRENLEGHSRLGIVVSKKVSLKSCVRNRLKRIIRENFRSFSPGLGEKDIVFCVRDKFETFSWQKFTHTVKETFSFLHTC